MVAAHDIDTNIVKIKIKNKNKEYYNFFRQDHRK